MFYKVNEVAKIAGISVRTLHHYDQIGLLQPEKLTSAGYRLYSENDLDRLQQILFFKELDLNLNEIKEILDSPSFDRKRALETHQELLMEKKNRLEAIIRSVQKTLNSLEGKSEMSKEEKFKPFDMKKIEEHQKKYAEETKQKYGQSNAYKESQQKTSTYTKNDWENITSQANEIYKQLAANMNKGPEDEKVQELIGQWRQHITDNYYNCTIEIFRGLGDMYVADERFTANIDQYGEGLASFMRDAMHHYCDMHQE